MTPDEIPERDWFAINEDGCGFIKDAKLEPQVTLKDTVTLLRQEIDRLQKQNEIMKESLEFYAKGAGLELVDEGRAYASHYVAYENDYESKYNHMDKPVGERARQALKDCEEL